MTVATQLKVMNGIICAKDCGLHLHTPAFMLVCFLISYMYTVDKCYRAAVSNRITSLARFVANGMPQIMVTSLFLMPNFCKKRYKDAKHLGVNCYI